MHDTLASGSTMRISTVVDACTRECGALVAAPQFRWTDAAARLSVAGDARGGLPPVVQSDNGTEFTSAALDHWAYWNHVLLDDRRPGKPVAHCVCEAFNGSLRRACLSQHWFATIAEAPLVLDACPCGRSTSGSFWRRNGGPGHWIRLSD